MEGTVRILDRNIHDSVEVILRRVLESTCAAYRCTCEMEYIYGSPALTADKHMTEIAVNAARRIVRGSETVGEFAGMMGGEDFAFYSELVPSSFVCIGCGGTVSNHNERFLVDEDSFPIGVALHVQTAMDFLNE